MEEQGIRMNNDHIDEPELEIDNRSIGNSFENSVSLHKKYYNFIACKFC